MKLSALVVYLIYTGTRTVSPGLLWTKHVPAITMRSASAETKKNNIEQYRWKLVRTQCSWMVSNVSKAPLPKQADKRGCHKFAAVLFLSIPYLFLICASNNPSSSAKSTHCHQSNWADLTATWSKKAISSMLSTIPGSKPLMWVWSTAPKMAPLN